MSDVERFWNVIEMKMGCNVPKHIQNILALNGYENAVSIKTLTPQDITELEVFARSGMESQIPEHANKLDYYGSYATKPKEFIFLPGYKRLIIEIISFIKEKTTLHGPDFFVFKTSIDVKQPVSRATRFSIKGKYKFKTKLSAETWSNYNFRLKRYQTYQKY